MTTLVEVSVPDIGDYKDVPIIELLVQPGDVVQAQQSLITLESDKASIEIPSSHSGVVKELMVALGDRISMGRVIALIEPPAASEPALIDSPAAPGGRRAAFIAPKNIPMTAITCIEDLRRLAKKRVPRMFYDYADSDSCTESTCRANEADFAAMKLRQRVAVNMEDRSLRTTMAGVDVAMPVALAPTGLDGRAVRSAPELGRCRVNQAALGRQADPQGHPGRGRRAPCGRQRRRRAGRLQPRRAPARWHTLVDQHAAGNRRCRRP